jgi:uncharacterized protein (UPF0335 family)
MVHLIDKSALVAEIERLKEEALQKKGQCKRHGLEKIMHQISAYNKILSFIDTIEVKEVDLEKHLKEDIEEVFFDLNGVAVKGATHYLTVEDVKDIAKHFFELGIKAQHDNWKVVDNINPPQADRNKIYCVFTKQRYILAKVIDHPQDDDLLQWKCTEFPNHRYDMCEGDKYMQIV